MLVSRCYLVWLAALPGLFATVCPSISSAEQPVSEMTHNVETQITDRPVGHILTNTNVWSPDGQWIVYDTRSDLAGETFDGSTIEIVNVATREVREVYQSRNSAHCGVATFSPRDKRVVFILGPENPTDDWKYAAWHRQGVMVDVDHPHVALPLDARNITPPFSQGALRGGTHVHVFDSAGEWVSFTYDDHLLATLDSQRSSAEHDRNQRNIGVSVTRQPVVVTHDHPRNHDGSSFSVLVTRTKNNPQPATDEISRACEESWIGTHGYLRPDGTRQRRAIAFQGTVATSAGKAISEVFVCDLPDDITQPGRTVGRHRDHTPGSASRRAAASNNQYSGTEISGSTRTSTLAPQLTRWLAHRLSHARRRRDRPTLDNFTQRRPT